MARRVLARRPTPDTAAPNAPCPAGEGRVDPARVSLRGCHVLIDLGTSTGISLGAPPTGAGREISCKYRSALMFSLESARRHGCESCHRVGRTPSLTFRAGMRAATRRQWHSQWESERRWSETQPAVERLGRGRQEPAASSFKRRLSDVYQRSDRRLVGGGVDAVIAPGAHMLTGDMCAALDVFPSAHGTGRDLSGTLFDRASRLPSLLRAGPQSRHSHQVSVRRERCGLLAVLRDDATLRDRPRHAADRRGGRCGSSHRRTTTEC